MSLSNNELSASRSRISDETLLSKIRAAWSESAPNRRQYSGPVSAELDYYFNGAMSDVSVLLETLSEQGTATEQFSHTIFSLRKATVVCDLIGNYLLSKDS